MSEDQLNEVSPPGFGATKGDDKGGTAAAFDRARKEGRFKGSKSDMFAIMWSQKNKGDKPHYKPGTDKKYKKYQKESASNPFQVHFDKDGKEYTSKGTPEQRKRIAKNIAANRKNAPDPYRSRPGESD